MKDKIHPRFFNATATCSCGTTFQTASTRRELKVEICSQCHPFYTGKQKLSNNREGQVEKFRQRYNKAAEAKAEKA